MDQPPINLLLWEGAYDSSPKTLNTPLHLLLPTMGPPFGWKVDLLSPVGFGSVQEFLSLRLPVFTSLSLWTYV